VLGSKTEALYPASDTAFSIMLSVTTSGSYSTVIFSVVRLTTTDCTWSNFLTASSIVTAQDAHVIPSITKTSFFDMAKPLLVCVFRSEEGRVGNECGVRICTLYS